jgi:uncharacterized protein YaaW (UPF0174 family)
MADRYEKLGGEESICRTNEEVILEEEQRLGKFAIEPTFRGHNFSMRELQPDLPESLWPRPPEDEL